MLSRIIGTGGMYAINAIIRVRFKLNKFYTAEKTTTTKKVKLEKLNLQRMLGFMKA